MPNVKISIHPRRLDSRLRGIEEWKISSQDKKDLIKFLEQLSIGKVNKRKRVGESRQVKYLDLLKIPLEYFKKPVSQITTKDMERFEKDLISNKIKSKKGVPFSDWTKSSIKRALIIYIKWKVPSKSASLTDWIDLGIPNKTPDYLKESDIEKLYKACKNNQERFLIAVLFDSGARAEEFHNIRFEDIQLPTKDEAFSRIMLKEEYSKTKGRNIALYWKHSLEAVRDFLKEREADGIKSDEPVFNMAYDNARQFLNRLGKKVLGKSIHYHLFRHSSATFYANKLNRQELCYRFGWTFSSRMPDTYISRSGMLNKELDKTFEATEVETLKKELEKTKLNYGIDISKLTEEQKQTALMFSNLKKEIENLKKIKTI